MTTSRTIPQSSNIPPMGDSTFNQQVVRPIVLIYSDRLMNFADRKLPAWLRARTSATSIVQISMIEFFDKARKNKYDLSDDLSTLLRTFVRNVVRRKVQQHLCQCRDIRRETRLTDDQWEKIDWDGVTWNDLRIPDEEGEALFTESIPEVSESFRTLVESIHQSMEIVEHQRIFGLLLETPRRPIREIALELNMNEAQVKQIIRLIRLSYTSLVQQWLEERA